MFREDICRRKVTIIYFGRAEIKVLRAIDAIKERELIRPGALLVLKLLLRSCMKAGESYVTRQWKVGMVYYPLSIIRYS